MDNYAKTSPKRGQLLRWLAWFALANGLVLAAVFTRYAVMMPDTVGILPQLFLVLSLLGHGFMVGLLLFVLCLPVVLIVARKRLVDAVAVLLATVLVMGVAIDTVVFSLYRFHMNGMVWEVITGGAAGQMLHMSAHTWTVAVLSCVGMLLGQAILCWFCWRWSEARRRNWGRVAALVVVLIIVSGQLIHVWADGTGYVAVTRQVRYLPGYKPLTAKKVMRKLGFETTAIKRMKMPDSARAFRYPGAPLELTGEATGHNLLVIVIDGWRRDFLAPDVTPTLDGFAQQSWRFDNHFSSGNATRFGIFGLIYGIPANYWHGALAEQTPPVLVEGLDQRGYEMGLYFSASTSSPEFDRTVFSSVRDRLESDTQGDDAAERDRAITDRFSRFLETREGDKPFFGFLFYDAPHSYVYPEDNAPFQPASGSINHLKLGKVTDPVPMMNRLKNSVHYVDGLIGEVLDQLERDGLLDNTVVVVTGDHGEQFNDDGLNYWGHNSGFGLAQTRVPMIVRWPGEEPKRFDHMTSHLDLAPTLLADLLGAQGDLSTLSTGQHLRDPGGRDFVLVSSWSSFAVVKHDRMIVVLPTGEVEQRALDYQLLKGESSNPEILLQAMEQMGRFCR